MTDKTTSPPPAYFLSLSLENVRSFGEKQTISFARPDGRPAQWTIILGDNGVGKTTVLKALAALQPTNEHQNRERTKYYPSFKYLTRESKWWPMRNTGHTSRINCEFVITAKVDISSELVGQEAINVLLPGDDYVFDDEDEYLPFESKYNGLSEKFKEAICYGYGAGRTTGNSTLSEIPENPDTCKSLFDDRADLLNPEEWFLQMEYGALKGDKQAGTSLERVKRVLLQVLPDVTDIQIKSVNGRNQQLELKTPYGWVRLRDMSLGYQTLVVWLTDFASKLFIRYPDSENPLEMPAIVLIDEIDLHLHPRWQRKLIGFLSGIFKNTQFIATAHSPLVVQAAGDKDANVVLLKREGDQTIVHQGRDLPDVRRWRLEQLFSSELFDETPPLSPQTEADLKRRNELRLKKRLTPKDKAELARLESTVDALPLGETVAEQRASNLLERLSRKLNLDEV